MNGGGREGWREGGREGGRGGGREGGRDAFNNEVSTGSASARMGPIM